MEHGILHVFTDWLTAREAAARYFGRRPGGHELWQYFGAVERGVRLGLLAKRRLAGEDRPRYILIAQCYEGLIEKIDNSAEIAYDNGMA